MAISDLIASVLQRYPMPKADKQNLQTEIENALRQELGGQRVYVNKGRQIVAEDVKAAFNGRNIAEVQQQFGISRARVYQILNDDRI